MSIILNQDVIIKIEYTEYMQINQNRLDSIPSNSISHLSKFGSALCTTEMVM